MSERSYKHSIRIARLAKPCPTLPVVPMNDDTFASLVPRSVKIEDRSRVVECLRRIFLETFIEQGKFTFAGMFTLRIYRSTEVKEGAKRLLLSILPYTSKGEKQWVYRGRKSLKFLPMSLPSESSV